MSLKIFLLIILHEICATAEQIFFKRGADNLKAHSLKRFKDCLLFVKDVIKIPTIWLAFIMTASAWLVWFTVLAGTELSIAVPVDSMQYIMIMIASYFFLGERMHWTRIVGTILILLGVAFVASS
jgi:drug/metabolite transporter (DMT)-like permease